MEWREERKRSRAEPWVPSTEEGSARETEGTSREAGGKQEQLPGRQIEYGGGSDQLLNTANQSRKRTGN